MNFELLGKSNAQSDGMGQLPREGMLAVPYVPMQGSAAQRYSKTDALSNGTLFPSLNLPFRLKTNAVDVAKSPLSELQALEFVLLELGLYLDTHPDDQEAFKLFQEYTELERKARDAYVKTGRVISPVESAQHDSFTWIDAPWPWCPQKEKGE